MNHNTIIEHIVKYAEDNRLKPDTLYYFIVFPVNHELVCFEDKNMTMEEFSTLLNAADMEKHISKVMNRQRFIKNIKYTTKLPKNHPVIVPFSFQDISSIRSSICECFFYFGCITVTTIIDTILYKDYEEKITARRSFIAECIKEIEYYQKYTVSEFEEILLQDNSDDFNTQFLIDNFETAYSYNESSILFELACQKYGYKLWNGNAWHNKTCRRNCPLADFCEGNTVEINGERLCRGQVYSREISYDDLPQDTPIYRQDGSVYITKARDDQIFGAFFAFSLDISSLGWSKKGGIEGGNVIMKLYKEFLKQHEYWSK